ncbi:hypothetical protein HGRIS_003500 [Hohenbuehelia grisea]|uniref:Cyclopropane-fatty-acyl-phospholipid synthase n=1 Tax=Hohenbuehelia grisea TaxID=104357 RepID=A0ABR3JG82_9AGAR
MHPVTVQASLLSAVASYNRPLWSIFVQYSRNRFLSSLRTGLLIGELIIEEGDLKHHFGAERPGALPVLLTIHDENAWARMALSLDLGFAEAYMYAELDCSSLKSLFHLWLLNRTTLTGASTFMDMVSAALSAVLIRTLGRQTLKMARWNVEVAYDTSNEFYQCFLSKEMMYSCALWSDDEGGVRGDLSTGPRSGDLEAAQLRKIKHILQKARLRSGDRLLEVGSGWGAMAITAAKMGCTVDTVTLSVEQKAMAERRALEEGVAERVRVHLLDYRQLPASFEHAFDAFVSCEMIEAVGPSHHNAYFRMVDWALKSDRGAAVITATAQPESRYSDYQSDCFARHYHWPNTFLPSATSLPVWVQTAIPGRLVLDSVEDHGIRLWSSFPSDTRY